MMRPVQISPVTARDIRRRELAAQQAALYERLDGEYDRIGRLYRTGSCAAAEQAEDIWLADLGLYELISDELRAL